MAKHPGDDGDWNLDSAAPSEMSIRERCNTQLGVTSPEVIEAMRDEERFVMGVANAFPMKRFTDRRPMPGRSREKP